MAIKTTVRVASTRQVTPAIRQIRVPKPDGFEFKAGQFANITLETSEGRVTNAYSMASAPNDEELAFACQDTPSAFTDHFLDLEEGDEVGLAGPYGRFTLGADDRQRVFVAGGIGITPILAMLRAQADSDHPPASLVFSNRHADGIPYRQDLSRLAGQDDALDVVHTITRDPQEDLEAGMVHGHVDAPLLDDLDLLRDDATYYLCGPPALVHDVYEELEDAHVPAAQIREEKFVGT